MKSYVRLLGPGTAAALLAMVAAGVWCACRTAFGNEHPAGYLVAAYLVGFPVVQYLLARAQIARVHSYAALQRTADVAARELTAPTPEFLVSRRPRGHAAGSAAPAS